MTGRPDQPGPDTTDGARPDERSPAPDPGRSPRTALWVGAIGGAVAWILLADLPVGARIWTAVLLAPLPAVLAGQHRLVVDPATLPRVPVYKSSIIALWVMALVTTLVSRASGYGPADIGIATIALPAGAAWAAGTTLAGVAVVFAAHALDIGGSAMLEAVIPRTPHEKSIFAGLSVTAGICEELVFRGFLIHTITAASGREGRGRRRRARSHPRRSRSRHRFHPALRRRARRDRCPRRNRFRAETPWQNGLIVALDRLRRTAVRTTVEGNVRRSVQ
jgi:membrane protease YdiL (CAAX protease family)